MSENTWYSGSAVMTVSLPSARTAPAQARVCSRFATMLPCVSIAPLGRPVVPPVYCRNARSSAPSRGAGASSARPRASASRKARAPVDAPRRHHVPQVLHGDVHQPALRRGEQVAHLRGDHAPHARAGERVLERVREVLQHHDGRRAGVLELEARAREAV